jgi:hypothetical protein
MFSDVERHLWRRVPQRSDELRQQVWRDGMDHAETQWS